MLELQIELDIFLYSVFKFFHIPTTLNHQTFPCSNKVTNSFSMQGRLNTFSFSSLGNRFLPRKQKTNKHHVSAEPESEVLSPMGKNSITKTRAELCLIINKSIFTLEPIAVPGHTGLCSKKGNAAWGWCTSAPSGAVMEYSRKTSRISDLEALMGKSPIAGLLQKLTGELVCPPYLPGALLTAHDALRGNLQNFCPRP